MGLANYSRAANVLPGVQCFPAVFYEVIMDCSSLISTHRATHEFYYSVFEVASGWWEIL